MKLAPGVRFIGWLVLTVIVSLIEVSLWPQIPGLSLLISPALLLVTLLVTIGGLTAGLSAAVIAGTILDYSSVLPGHVHILALLTMCVSVWLIIRRVLATRSRLTLLLATAVGVASYYGLLWLMSTGLQLFQPEVLHPLWSEWVWYPICQIVIHPLIVGLIWITSGRGQYHQVAMATPF